MGIPGMMSYLNDKHNVFKKTTKKYSPQPREVMGCSDGGGSGARRGPCLVFDDATLPMIVRELQHESYDVQRGGWATCFRSSSKDFIETLLLDYQCDLVWVRDGGVNDKPNTIGQDFYDKFHWRCAAADAMISCAEDRDINRRTVDMAHDLSKSKSMFETYAVMQAFEIVAARPTLADQVRVVEAPANCADAEVVRQAEKMRSKHGGERDHFIVTSDTDILFFGDMSPDIGVVLLSFESEFNAGSRKQGHLAADERWSQPRASKGRSGHRQPAYSSRGALWSCSLTSFRFTCCTVAVDIAGAFGVEVELLPVLAACLGGDLAAFDRGVHNFTIRLKSAVLKKHFEDPDFIKTFKALKPALMHELHAEASRRRKGGHHDPRACHYGKYCNVTSCPKEHPAGRMFCRSEQGNGRCTRPGCNYKHSKSIAFRIEARTLTNSGGVNASGDVVFKFYDSFEDAMSELKELHEKLKSSTFGVGLYPYLRFGVSSIKSHQNTIVSKTAELIKQSNWCCNGKLDIEVCARDVCAWLRQVSMKKAADEEQHVAAFRRAIEIHKIPAVSGHPAPVGVSNQFVQRSLSFFALVLASRHFEVAVQLGTVRRTHGVCRSLYLHLDDCVCDGSIEATHHARCWVGCVLPWSFT